MIKMYNKFFYADENTEGTSLFDLTLIVGGFVFLLGYIVSNLIGG